MCLACGYSGAEVQGPLALLKYRCPSCQTDLYARPPRSYAQMEGLAPAATAPVERARLEEWAARLLAVERMRRQRRRRAAFVVGLMTGSAFFTVMIGLAVFLL